jgi:hypothetical protein
MRYRKLSPAGDYVAGHGNADFWVDQPEAVGQAVLTRMLLYEGEWFLDTYEGTPWGGFPLNPLVVERGQILGTHTQLTRDVALQSRALGTPGIMNIASYSSAVDPDTRRFSVEMTVNTIYGQVALAAGLTTPVPAPNQSLWDGGLSVWDQTMSPWDKAG